MAGYLYLFVPTHHIGVGVKDDDDDDDDIHLIYKRNIVFVKFACGLMAEDFQSKLCLICR